MVLKKIISGLLFALSVIMIGIGIFLMNSNKYIFTTALSKTFYYITSNCDKDYLPKELSEAKAYRVATNNSLKIDDEDFISLTGDIYQNNDHHYLSINSKIDGIDFIDIEALLKDSKIYFKINEVMKEFYYEELDVENIEKLTHNDLEILLKHLKNGILKDLNDNDFDKSKAILELDGIKINTTKIALDFTDKDLYEITVHLLESIGSDKDAINVLQKVNNNITEDEIQDLLEDLTNRDIHFENKVLLHLAFYVKSSNNPVRVELIFGGESQPDSIITDTGTFLFDIYDNKNNYKTYSFKFIENNSIVLEWKEEYVSESKANLYFMIGEGLTDSDSFKMNGTYNQSMNAIVIDLDLLIHDVNIGNINYQLETVKEGKEYQLDFNFSIDVEDEKVTFVSNNDIFLNDNFPDVDISKAISLGNVSDEEIQEIINYIYDKLEESGLIYYDDDLSETVLDFNMDTMKNYAIDYFDTVGLPQNVGDKKKATLNQIIDAGFLFPLEDENGNQYDLDISYVEIVKNSDSYFMTIYLKNDVKENTKYFYFVSDSSCGKSLCEK